MSSINTFSYKKRVIVTLVLIVVYNFLLSMIPIPGADRSIIWRHVPKNSLEYLFSFPFSIKALGISPLIMAYFIMSFLYYFLLRRGKGQNFPGDVPNRFLVPLILTTLAISIFLGWGYARFIGKMPSTDYATGFPQKFLITMMLASSVFLGFLIIITIDRLDVVDGMFVILFLHPAFFLGFKSGFQSLYHYLTLTQSGNETLRRIGVFAFIVICACLLIKKTWRPGILSYKIPLRKGGGITIPIYYGGLFFFKAVNIFLTDLLIYLTIILMPHSHMTWLYRVETILAIFAGYGMYIRLGRWVIDWKAFKEKISPDISPDAIFKATYKRFGQIYLVIYLVFYILEMTLQTGDLSKSIFALSSNWELILLFIIFIREGWKEKQILTKDYVPVLKTNRLEDLAAGQIALAEENINPISHQRLYNYLAGCVIGPLSEKILYVLPADKARAEEILNTMKNAKHTI